MIKVASLLLFFLFVSLQAQNDGFYSVDTVSYESSFDSGDNRSSLSLLTINLWGLPVKLPGHAQKERFQNIPQMLFKGQQDIICVQEIFSKRLRKRLLKSIPSSYAVFSDYSCNETIFGWVKKDCHGGLMTLSKYPIIEETFYRYPKSRDMRLEERAGEKGFLLTKIRINEEYIYVINTHLYSGPSEVDEMHRLRQIKYMHEVLSEIPSFNHHYAIMLGDLNVRHPELAELTGRPSSSVYAYIQDEMRFEEYDLNRDANIYTIDYHQNDYTPEGEDLQKLDYIMYRDPRGYAQQKEKSTVVFKNDEAISDHLGLSCSVLLGKQTLLASSVVEIAE